MYEKTREKINKCDWSEVISSCDWSFCVLCFNKYEYACKVLRHNRTTKSQTFFKIVFSYSKDARLVDFFWNFKFEWLRIDCTHKYYYRKSLRHKTTNLIVKERWKTKNSGLFAHNMPVKRMPSVVDWISKQTAPWYIKLKFFKNSGSKNSNQNLEFIETSILWKVKNLGVCT